MNNKTIRFLNTAAVVPLLAYEKNPPAKLQLSSLSSNIPRQRIAESPPHLLQNLAEGGGHEGMETQGFNPTNF